MSDYLGPFYLGPNGTANNGIYTGDALQCLGKIPDASLDAIVTDPPYCAGAISEANRTRAKGHGLRSETIHRFGWFIGDNMGTAGIAWLLRAMAVEARRTVKDSGSVVVFADWRMVPALVPAIESAGLRYQALVVWDKGSMGLGYGFRHQYELAMHFTLGMPEYWDRATADIITVPRIATQERVHQTQKPIQLMRAILQVVCPPGGITLDPFCGSGSTALAAIELGIHYLCFEIDPQIATDARNRVRNMQPPLFVAEPEQMELMP